MILIVTIFCLLRCCAVPDDNDVVKRWATTIVKIKIDVAEPCLQVEMGGDNSRKTFFCFFVNFQ